MACRCDARTRKSFRERHTDVRDLNRMAQALRHPSFGPEDGVFLGEDRIHEGDRVLFTKNSRELDVSNGEFGEVVRIRSPWLGLLSGPRVTVRVDGDDGASPRLVTLDTFDYPHLTLGYAATTHKAQGATVEKTFVLAGGWMQDRELTYVQMSRARDLTWIHAAAHDVDEDVSALTYTMSVSRPKVLAHALHRDPLHPSMLM